MKTSKFLIFQNFSFETLQPNETPGKEAYLLLGPKFEDPSRLTTTSAIYFCSMKLTPQQYYERNIARYNEKIAAVKAADGNAVAPQGVDLPAQLGAAHSEDTLQLPAGDGVCLALVVEFKILCKGFVDRHSSSFPGPLSRSRRSNERKKEGAAFPHPGIRPLGIFLLHHVREERLGYSVLF